jgi:hypothetical protein
MTTEDDFQAMFDEFRFNTDNYGIFADWLRDRDDSRADGYAAMGLLRRSPRPVAHVLGYDFAFEWYDAAYQFSQTDPESDLSTAWFEKLQGGTLNEESDQPPHRTYATAREAREDAARAWLLLTADEQAAILAKATVPA